MTQLILKSETKAWDGRLAFYAHGSEVCQTEMRFSVFLPPQAEQGPVPVLYWLSGLTCTEENFMVKAGAQRCAARLGLMLVAPDTSPRGLGLPGEDDAWDFGTGAGFYLNASRSPWSTNYRMYDYVTEELPRLVQDNFPALAGRASIFGHSMGGHGALMIAQRNPARYSSVSAFSPICAPSECPWGQKAFTNYLGEDRALWRQYDTHAILQGLKTALPMLVDQGEADPFLKEQLKPDLLERVCNEKGHDLILNMRPGYDHGYYFIATYIENHIRYHAEALKRSVSRRQRRSKG